VTVAVENRSTAYDIDQFADQEKIQMTNADKKSRKKKKSGRIISISQGSSAKSQRRKRNPFLIIGISLLTIAVAIVAITMVRFSAQLNELNDELYKEQKVLEEMKDQETRYQLSINKLLTDSYIREYAEKKLDMVPVKKAQKQYLALTEGDSGTVFADSDDNAFEFILKAFNGFFG